MIRRFSILVTQLRGIMDNRKRKSLLRSTVITALVSLLALLARTTPALADKCLKDAYGKNVQCTANDVSIAYADNPRNLDGSKLTQCTAGQKLSFIADFHVTTTATSRENIGLYFQTAGGSNAITGTCSDNIISQLHHTNLQCTGSGAPFACCTGLGTGSCALCG